MAETTSMTGANDADLRGLVGDAGRTRARERSDWSEVIQAYRDLWRDPARFRQH